MTTGNAQNTEYTDHITAILEYLCFFMQRMYGEQILFFDFFSLHSSHSVYSMDIARIDKSTQTHDSIINGIFSSFFRVVFMQTMLFNSFDEIQMYLWTGGRKWHTSNRKAMMMMMRENVSATKRERESERNRFKECSVEKQLFYIYMKPCGTSTDSAFAVNGNWTKNKKWNQAPNTWCSKVHCAV